MSQVTFRKEYSPGSVSVYQTPKMRVPRWRALIKEYTKEVVRDDRGLVVMVDGEPKVRTKSRNLYKSFGDIECVPMRGGKHTGERAAMRELASWRSELERAADAEYERAIAEPEEAEAPEPQGFDYGALTVAELMDTYIDFRIEQGIEPSTLEGYRYSAKRCAKYLHGMRAAELTEDDLLAFNAKMKSDGLSDTTRNKSLKFLKMVYGRLAKKVGRNPFDDFDRNDMPSPNPAAPNPLNEESIGVLFDYLDILPATPFATAVALAIHTGMRVSEICGLRFEDIDLDQQDIHVRHSIGRSSDKPGGLYRKKPKDTSRTKKQDPTRHVAVSPMIESIIESRREYIARQVMDELRVTRATATEVVDTLYVIGETDGEYANPAIISRQWRSLVKELGLMGEDRRPPTFHDLRDTYATIAITNGIDPLTVAANLGHRDPSITMTRYAKAITKARKEAQAKMDGFYQQYRRKEAASKQS